MAFQGNAFQTDSSERAYQLALSDTLELASSGTLDPSRTLTLTQELTLPVDTVFDLGAPASVTIRIRVFTQRPSRHSGFPPLAPGENDVLAEPVLFFHKDAQVNLDFTVLNPDGTAYNLTDATVELLAKPERGSTLTFACSLVDAVNGKCRRLVAANDFAAGPYQAQLRVTNTPVVFHSVYFRILVGQAIE